MSLEWLFAILAIAFVVSGLGSIFCLKCFWQMKGGRPVEFLATFNIYAFLASTFGMAAVILAITYLTFGWTGIIVAVATFTLLFLVKMGLRNRRHSSHHAW